MDGERIRTLVVDDEPLAREGILELLAADPEVEVVGACANGVQALEALRRHRPALLFLDVQMPEMDGFEMLEATPADLMPVIVFVTAHDQYALRAFEMNALDYLLKPFDDERFEKALSRAKTQVRRARADGTGRHLRRIVVRSAGRVLFLNTDEIDWIGAADYYVELHVGGRSHLLREPMQRLEERLDPERFVRIHRSAIVNVDRIKEIRAGGTGDRTVILHDGTKLRLSRSRRDKLQGLMRRSG